MKKIIIITLAIMVGACAQQTQQKETEEVMEEPQKAEKVLRHVVILSSMMTPQKKL